MRWLGAAGRGTFAQTLHRGCDMPLGAPCTDSLRVSDETRRTAIGTAAAATYGGASMTLSQMRSKQVWARSSSDRVLGDSREVDDRDSVSKRVGCPSQTASTNGSRIARK
jgi:hypothetical protein